MKRITIILLAAAILVSCVEQKKDFLRTDGTKIVDGEGENVLLRGYINGCMILRIKAC